MSVIILFCFIKGQKRIISLKLCTFRCRYVQGDQNFELLYFMKYPWQDAFTGKTKPCLKYPREQDWNFPWNSKFWYESSCSSKRILHIHVYFTHVLPPSDVSLINNIFALCKMKTCTKKCRRLYDFPRFPLHITYYVYLLLHWHRNVKCFA